MDGIVGMIKMSLHPGGNDQWKLCDGSKLAVVDFPELFALVGHKFGGDGNEFCLPDLRGDQGHYLLKVRSGPADTSYQGIVSQMVLWVGEELPANWLPCDGRAVPANSYPTLQRIVAKSHPTAIHGFHLPKADAIPGVRYIICTEGQDPDPQANSEKESDDDY